MSQIQEATGIPADVMDMVPGWNDAVSLGQPVYTLSEIADNIESEIKAHA
jgi:hypothetical protein